MPARTAGARKSFVPLEIFKDRNFVTALFLMLLVALIMLASSALLPPYLENLGGYSVTETGLLMAPRGVGSFPSQATISSPSALKALTWTRAPGLYVS